MVERLHHSHVSGEQNVGGQGAVACVAWSWGSS